MLMPPAPHRKPDDCCEAIRRQVFAACDGELRTEVLVTIDAHLQHCAPCRTQYAADATFLRVVREAVSTDVAPQSLRDRIALLIHAQTTENAPA